MQVIENLIERIGRATSWLTTILVLFVCFDVIRRYLLKDTAAWIMEMQWHMFAIIFLLAAGYTLKHNKHVRVDLFYEKFSAKEKAWVNLIGSALFLLPWCAVIIYYSSIYAWNAWELGESSPDPDGLPARYIIKACIPIGMTLLLLQGIVVAVRSYKIIKTERDD